MLLSIGFIFITITWHISVSNHQQINCSFHSEFGLTPKKQHSSTSLLAFVRPWWRMKWKHFPRYWPFVRGIHRSPVNSHHKGQWRGTLMFSLICVWINRWVNNREAGDWRRHRAHYDVIVMRNPQRETFLCHDVILSLLYKSNRVKVVVVSFISNRTQQ